MAIFVGRVAPPPPQTSTGCEQYYSTGTHHSFEIAYEPSNHDKTKPQLCAFCKLGPDFAYGKFFTDDENNVSVHQYCMFFASGLAQNGEDEEGFDGFMISDIIREMNRGRRLRCLFCKRFGATVGCAVLACNVKYHYPCGNKTNSLHQFCGNFRAYCGKHKPTQSLMQKVHWRNVRCAICLEDAEGDEELEYFLKMPCCKDQFIHRECLQKQAFSSGYFFRCPTCNNGEKFLAEMKQFGIFVPERDALWEDGDAYADLLEVYGRCDVRYCYCPTGRVFKAKSGHWRIHRCHECGQSGIHHKCAEILGMPTKHYICNVCVDVQNRVRFAEIMDQKTVQCAVVLTDIAPNRVRSYSTDSKCSLQSTECDSTRMDVFNASKRIEIGPVQTVDRLIPERASFHASSRDNRISPRRDALHQNIGVNCDSMAVELLPNQMSANHMGLNDTHLVSKQKGVDRDKRYLNVIAGRKLVLVPRSSIHESRSISGASNTTAVGRTNQKSKVSVRKRNSDHAEQERRSSQTRDSVVGTTEACWKKRRSSQINKTSVQKQNGILGAEENAIENVIVSNVERKEISASRQDHMSSVDKKVADGISIADSNATGSPAILHTMNSAFCRSPRYTSAKFHLSNSNCNPCKLRNNSKNTLSNRREARQSCKIKCALYRYIENVLSDGS